MKKSVCPFCHAAGTGRVTSMLGDHRHWVQCNKCGARTGFYFTADEAVKAWKDASPIYVEGK